MSELINIIFVCSIPVIAVDAFFLSILLAVAICSAKERFKK